MAINIVSFPHSSKEEKLEDVVDEEEGDDDYIDIEVSSYSIFNSNSFNNSPQSARMLNTSSREFEFHMFSSYLEREQPPTSPADELFYKGKLLPLHLPPRLQMVEKLMENPSMPGLRNTGEEELYCTPLTTSPSTPVGIYSTPFESCYGSPSVSGELNTDEYFFKYREDDTGSTNQKKSWGKKIKMLGESGLVSRFKAPKAYLRSLFAKYSCSNESCATNIEQSASILSKIDNAMNQQSTKVTEKPSLSMDGRRSSRKVSEAEKDLHRRRMSLSGSNKRCRPSKKASIYSPCTSSSLSSDTSSSSNDSNGSSQLQFLQRSGNGNSNVESPIQGAIKHCKQSQHLRKNVMVSAEPVKESNAQS